MANNMKQLSLCWSCTGECEWMKTEKPVNGWIADRSKTWVNGWFVKNCPKFIPTARAIGRLYPVELIKVDKYHTCPTCGQICGSRWAVCTACGQRVYSKKERK